MTIAPQAAPLTCDSIEEAIRAVRERGMRLSTPRRLVLEALFSADGPVSAVHLASTLAIDVTSVYRNLEVLERYGLLRHVHLGHGPGLYALSGRHEVEYLYCERCSKVTSVSLDQLDPLRDQLRASFGHEARFTHFPIVGLCRRCATKTGRRRGTDVKSMRAKLGVEAEMKYDEHPHAHPHTHEHSHGGNEHAHPHTSHEHRHTEHEHEHSHGDYVHAHEHVHEKGLEEDHGHSH